METSNGISFGFIVILSIDRLGSRSHSNQLNINEVSVNATNKSKFSGRRGGVAKPISARVDLKQTPHLRPGVAKEDCLGLDSEDARQIRISINRDGRYICRRRQSMIQRNDLLQLELL